MTDDLSQRVARVEAYLARFDQHVATYGRFPAGLEPTAEDLRAILAALSRPVEINNKPT